MCLLDIMTYIVEWNGKSNEHHDSYCRCHGSGQSISRPKRRFPHVSKCGESKGNRHQQWENQSAGRHWAKSNCERTVPNRREQSAELAT